MATGRLPMHKIREILRFKWVLARTHRDTAKALGVSLGAVGSVLRRAADRGLTWNEVEQISDEALELQFYPPRIISKREQDLPDPAWIHSELHRAGVTLELLHLEYLQKHPTGYKYSAFCLYYRKWRKRQKPSMRQMHKAGEKIFTDFSGKRPRIVDRTTGEVKPVELFVATLGASNYTYAEAVLSQKIVDWVYCHVHAFEYIRGVTAVLVPDQLKSAVTRSDRYEPGLQRTYEDMARHYGTAIIPARPRKPKDKAKVEVAVQIVQRWILARLRDEVFFSLAALNKRIRELLQELNKRPMKTYGGQSRRELFEKIDRPALRPLPAEPYAVVEWKKVKVNIDYHVDIDRHFYSVPHRYIHQKLEARFSATTVEILAKGQRVASHKRSYQPGLHSTVAEHMPKAHQKHLEWTPSRFIHWAESIGPSTQILVSRILTSRPHPEMGYRSCLGILNLSKRYEHERLEAACARALAVDARSYRHVANILKNGLDRVPLEQAQQEQLPLQHENVRGPDYYQ